MHWERNIKEPKRKNQKSIFFFFKQLGNYSFLTKPHFSQTVTQRIDLAVLFTIESGAPNHSNIFDTCQRCHVFDTSEGIY